jgi:hypothetical protein
MMDVLIEHGADVNQQDNNGKTALHIVADRSDSQSQTCIDMLLQKKADINVLSTDKETPLYLACNRGATNTIEKMLASCPVVCHPNAKQPLQWRSNGLCRLCKAQGPGGKGAFLGAPNGISFKLSDIECSQIN